MKNSLLLKIIIPCYCIVSILLCLYLILGIYFLNISDLQKLIILFLAIILYFSGRLIKKRILPLYSNLRIYYTIAQICILVVFAFFIIQSRDLSFGIE